MILYVIPERGFNDVAPFINPDFSWPCCRNWHIRISHKRETVIQEKNKISIRKYKAFALIAKPFITYCISTVNFLKVISSQQGWSADKVPFFTVHLPLKWAIQVHVSAWSASWPHTSINVFTTKSKVLTGSLKSTRFFKSESLSMVLSSGRFVSFVVMIRCCFSTNIVEKYQK